MPMKIKWVRGNERISFNRPNIWFCLGVKGSGKSSFLETLGEYHLDMNHVVLDLFGSADGEGLAWLRSPYAENKRILLLHGENVDVDCSFDVKTASKLTLKDFDQYDLIINARPLYSNADDEFMNAAQIMDKIYKRISWKRLLYCVVREAANLFYSRLKISENQVMAKSQMIYMIREARHVGMSMGLDSLRYYAIDIDIRNITDYLILKSQGLLGLSKDLKWLYSIFQPLSIRNLPPDRFIILTRKGCIGMGRFTEVTWHKQEKENILRAVGIHVEPAAEPPKQAEYRGTFKTVSDKEHAEIIRLYIEEKMAMHVIAKQIGRSNRTVYEHIQKHNESIIRSAFCPICRRVKSSLEKEMAKRNKKVD